MDQVISLLIRIICPMARPKSAFSQRTIIYTEIYKEKPPQTAIVRSGMASPARFERAAFRLGGERSILLSYRDIYTIFTF